MIGIRGSDEILNANVEIYNNYFENIRDNPIEPEADAHNWWMHHNRIKNAHALFSFTKVGGGDWFVFNNTGWFDQAPGGDTNAGGKIFKFAKEGPYPDKKFYAFNNSWYSRSPLVASGQSRNFTYWNNANYFVQQKAVANKKYWHDSYVSDYNLSNIDFSEGLSEFKQDTNSIVVEESVFVDAEKGDFRLRPNAKAKDAGRIVELNGWKSEYDGSAPDIGAYEGDRLLPGPAFRFDNSGGEESPRIVQIRMEKKILRILFSVPIKEPNNKTALLSISDNSIMIKCIFSAYEMNCPVDKTISLDKVKRVLLSSAISGKNGLPITLWAAPTDYLSIGLY